MQVLLSCDGPYDNVIKVKPPMVFGRPEVDQLVAALVGLLQEELTSQQWQVLMAAEEEHWQQVVAPRMALYQRNRALLLEGGSS
jgi:ethanolamine-phosphate phospho-lyase